MTLLQTYFLANFQLLKNTQKETLFLKSVFAVVRKCELQNRNRVREKGSVCKTLPGPGVKTFKKNCRVKRGREPFLKTRKVLIKICNISHLLFCKLSHEFISCVSRKTKMPNCIVFFCSTNHRGNSYGSTSTPTNISSIKTDMF